MEFLSLTDRDIESEGVEMKCLEGTHVGSIIGHFCRYLFNLILGCGAIFVLIFFITDIDKVRVFLLGVNTEKKNLKMSLPK